MQWAIPYRPCQRPPRRRVSSAALVMTLARDRGGGRLRRRVELMAGPVHRAAALVATPGAGSRIAAPDRGHRSVTRVGVRLRAGLVALEKYLAYAPVWKPPGRVGVTQLPEREFGCFSGPSIRQAVAGRHQPTLIRRAGETISRVMRLALEPGPTPPRWPCTDPVVRLF
jgi:hypothetical protein